MGKRFGVREVHGLALGLLVVVVDEDDLRGESAEEKGIGKSCTDIAAAHHGYARWLSIIITHSLLEFGGECEVDLQSPNNEREH